MTVTHVAPPRQAGPGAYAAPLNAVDEMTCRDEDGVRHLLIQKEITVDDPYLADHFPGRTVYPGVFILETVRQGVIAVLGERDGVLPDLQAVQGLRFLGGMHPGERLTIEVVVRPEPDGSFQVQARCRRDNAAQVARLQLTFGYQAGSDV